MRGARCGARCIKVIAGGLAKETDTNGRDAAILCDISEANLTFISSSFDGSGALVVRATIKSHGDQ